MPAITQDSFDSTSWHDNYVHALRLIEGAHGTGELWLEIDHILEWIDGDAASPLFRIAPARLRFYGVFNLRLNFDWSSCAMGPFQIDGIKRRTERREHYEATIWTIPVSFPSGSIEFDATGYVQDLTGQEVTVNRQWLTRAERGDV